MSICVIISGKDEIILKLGSFINLKLLLYDSSEVPAFKPRLKHQNIIFLRFGNVIRQYIYFVGGWLNVFSVWRRVLAIIDDCVNESLGKDDRLNLSPE